MAIYTQLQLVSASNATYTTNGVGNITGATVRSLNLDWISSSVLVPMTSSMTVASSSFAVSASYAPAASPFPFSGSATITGSAYGNVVAVTVASNTASIDLQAGNFFTATLANNATTFFNFTNVKPGLTANLILTTGTVSTASFSSNVKQPSGSSYLPSSGSGRIDALTVVSVDSSNLYLLAAKTFI